MTAEADVLGLLYAIGTTAATALVRIERGDRLRVGRALDLGAHGVMVPRVDSAADVAQALVHALPAGGPARGRARRRGQGFGRVGHADIGTLNDVRSGSSRSRRAAVADADAIAAIDGVDVLFVGPADLSHSLGVPGRFDDPAYLAAIDAVLAAAARTARRPGSCCTTRP